MAVYAVGDLQGCLTPFETLLDKLDFDPERDRLWLCGDLINRGPRSLATLRRARELVERGVADAVLGNHDLTLLAVAAGLRRPRRKDTLQDILDADDADDLLGWLRGLPLLHHDRKLAVTMIHAGLAPSWDLAQARRCADEVQSVLRGDDESYRQFLAQMFGDAPDRWRDDLSGHARLRCITNIFTRMRFCTAEGVLSFEHKGPPGSQPAALLPWYSVPGRRSAGETVVFGHWAALGYHHENGVHALDSGCVWGGRLTALRLDGGGPRRVTSVACGEPD